jgi:hypothetical protein
MSVARVRAACWAISTPWSQGDGPQQPRGHAGATGVTGRVQYGPLMHAKAALAVCVHYLPVGRAAALMASLTGVKVSAGFMAGVGGKAAARRDPFMERVRDLLREAGVLCADETPDRAGEAGLNGTRRRRPTSRAFTVTWQRPACKSAWAVLLAPGIPSPRKTLARLSREAGEDWGKEKC